MLTIITLNLNYYFDKHGSWEIRKRLIAQVLASNNPDIVILQAVARHPDLYNGKDQALQLCDELKGFQTHYFIEAQRQPDGLAQGSAIISTLPLLEKSFIKLNLKTGLDDPNHRVLLKSTFETQGGKLDVYNGHFSWVHEQAIENVMQATDLMKTGSSRALLGGDFNTTSDSTAFQPLRDAGFTDAWQKLRGNAGGETFESDRPDIRIDYFWVSPALSSQLNRIELIHPPADSGARLSDHLGLMVVIADHAFPNTGSNTKQ